MGPLEFRVNDVNGFLAIFEWAKAVTGKMPYTPSSPSSLGMTYYLLNCKH